MGMVKRISEARSLKGHLHRTAESTGHGEVRGPLGVAGAMGWTVGLGIGDATAEAKNIDDCNILVCTSEKLDSCFDIGQNWFQTSVVLWRMNSIS